jgi:hypothetical protein
MLEKTKFNGWKNRWFNSGLRRIPTKLTWIRIHVVAATIKAFCLPWNTFPVRMTIFISQILRIYLAVLNYLLARWRLGIVLVLPGLYLVPSRNGMFRITVTLPYLTTKDIRVWYKLNYYSTREIYLLVLTRWNIFRSYTELNKYPLYKKLNLKTKVIPCSNTW